MSDGLKAVALFVAIAGLWFLSTQVGVAQIPQSDTFEVPEPTSMSLLASGVAGALYAIWRSRK